MTRRFCLALLFVLAGTPFAEAHSAARGFVLLLPTGFVIAGGALAVAATFCIVSLLPGGAFRPPQRHSGSSGFAARWPSLVSAALLAALVWVGFVGPNDPLENLLPLSIWTLWWVAIVLLHPVLGNLWARINPFSGIASLWPPPRRRYPEALAYLPAFLIFAAFAWFQLVYPGPDNPVVLARVVAAYGVLTLAATIAFGPAAWLERADPFAVFFSQLAAVAPYSTGSRPRWRVPGIGLILLPALPLSGVCFVLLTLSSISFDGFASTFAWLSLVGVNPLDYPGRTAMMAANSLGFAASFLALALAFGAAVASGWAWAGRPGRLVPLLGRLVFTLIPISIAFHFAHYLSDTVLDLQYLLRALNDPLERGADLLGLGDLHVTASFQNSAAGALQLFSVQTAAIVLGHLVAVWVAHAMALETCPKAPLRLEAPLAAFMVLYTAFGLWLLATPAIS
jgi:hypothetical protein